MAIEILVPFGLDNAGHVVTTTDPDVIVQQHVEALIETNPGERVMIPDYGVATRAFVFGPDNGDIVTTSLVNAVSTAIATWEPSVTVNNITALPVAGEFGAAAVQVEYTPAAVSMYTVVQQATILVGGTVVTDPATGSA